MAKGGYRPGAGRPKGSKNRVKSFTDLGGTLSPLEYMLAVVNDLECDTMRRDRMAIAAAPYCHARVSDQRIGKKEATDKAAREAGDGTEWGSDLRVVIDNT